LKKREGKRGIPVLRVPHGGKEKRVRRILFRLGKGERGIGRKLHPRNGTGKEGTGPASVPNRKKKRSLFKKADTGK